MSTITTKNKYMIYMINHVWKMICSWWFFGGNLGAVAWLLPSQSYLLELSNEKFSERKLVLDISFWGAWVLHTVSWIFNFWEINILWFCTSFVLYKMKKTFGGSRWKLRKLTGVSRSWPMSIGHVLCGGAINFTVHTIIIFCRSWFMWWREIGRSRVQTLDQTAWSFYWSWVWFPGQVACFRPVWFMAYVRQM